MKLNFTGLSIIILGISILISSFVISNSISKFDSPQSVPTTIEYKEEYKGIQLFAKEEIVKQLGISIEEFDKLDRMQSVSFGKGIPFLETTSGTKYYSIQAFEKWLSDTNHYLSKE